MNPLELALAQRDGLVESLRELVRYVKKAGGYMTYEDQLVLWRAEAALVEAERKP